MEQQKFSCYFGFLSYSYLIIEFKRLESGGGLWGRVQWLGLISYLPQNQLLLSRWFDYFFEEQKFKLSTATSIDRERYLSAREKWVVVVVSFDPSGYFLSV